MGGRLLSLRWILEGPTELLGERGLLQRQALLGRYPDYARLADQAAQIRTKLAAKPLVSAAVDARREQSQLLDSLAQISQQQELLLRQMAVRRDPADMVFPPLRKTKDVQQSLPDGQVLLAFFQTRERLYAFLFSHDRYAAWQVRSQAALQKQVTTLLARHGQLRGQSRADLGGIGQGQLARAGAKVMHSLLDHSNVDLAGNFDEIVIVPDGFLWYLPFEALPVGPPGEQRLLISQARVRYAPTVGLAVPHRRRPEAAAQHRRRAGQFASAGRRHRGSRGVSSVWRRP